MFKRYEKGKCYIIAEIGGNFTTYEQAKLLIDEANKCCVDAVKLQTYRAETVASREAMFDMENTGLASQYDIFKKYEIDEKLHRMVFDYIDSLGLDWFSTPAHETDVDMLEGLGVGAYKIGSDDAVNIPFLKYVARKNKPVILSTGMCEMGEIKESVSAIIKEGNDNIILLHTVSNYPTRPENANLAAMVMMANEFPQFDVGYSDHTIGTTACICAAAMGARVIEKHFTYDKKAEGPDHMLSADPIEMKELVEKIREFELMKGDGVKKHSVTEDKMRKNTRKSVVLIGPVKRGKLISKEAIAIKRPGYGIPPKCVEQAIGKRAKKDLNKDDVLMWEDIG